MRNGLEAESSIPIIFIHFPPIKQKNSSKKIKIGEKDKIFYDSEKEKTITIKEVWGGEADVSIPKSTKRRQVRLFAPPRLDRKDIKKEILEAFKVYVKETVPL